MKKMTRQLLIYDRAVPVNKEKHGDLSVKTGKSYAFAREVNSVPLVAVEFPAAAMEYVIVFVGDGKAVMPAVILGAKDQQNLYLDVGGNWSADYVPAFLRRYPFVFASSDDGKNFTLCIDEEFEGCNHEAIGERLFDAEGERTQYLGSVLEFLSTYQAQFRRTQAFCDKLTKLDLFESKRLNVSLEDNKPISLSGFMTVSREKLKRLSDAQLGELAKSDELELVYLHLHSMRNVSRLAERLSAISGNSDLTETVPEASPLHS